MEKAKVEESSNELIPVTIESNDRYRFCTRRGGPNEYYRTDEMDEGAEGLCPE